jgi:hypothetical protein
MQRQNDIVSLSINNKWRPRLAARSALHYRDQPSYGNFREIDFARENYRRRGPQPDDNDKVCTGSMSSKICAETAARSNPNP